MRHSHRTLAFSAAAAVLAVLVAGCSRPPKKAEAPPPAAVEVVTASRTDIIETVEVVGNVKALRDVVLSAKMGGKVANVPFREGDRVGAGAVVAQQDPQDYANNLKASQAALASAEARLAQARTGATLQDTVSATAVRQAEQGVQIAREQLAMARQGARPQERRQAENAVSVAKASFENAKANFGRSQKLFEQGAIAKAMLEADQRAYEMAEAQLKSAEEALSLVREGVRAEELRIAQNSLRVAEQTLERARADMKQRDIRRDDVRAAQAGVQQARAAVQIAAQAFKDSAVRTPIGGLVAMRDVEPGQMAAPGVPLMRVYDPATVYFEATVSESQIARVKKGQPVEVRSDAIPGQVFSGRVAEIFPAAQTDNRSFGARVSLNAPAGGLKPGMFAKARITVETHPDHLSLQKDAIFTNARGQAIYVVKQEMLTRTIPPAKPNEKPTTKKEQGLVVRLRQVTTGVQSDGIIELVSGAEDGDRVVRSGQTFLRDGQEISIVSAGAEAR